MRFYRFAMFIVPTLLAWGWFALLMRADKATRGMWLPRALIWLPTAAGIAWLAGSEGWYWWIVASGIGFLVLDVAFNWIVGTLIWFELPREWTYTARLKRKKAEDAVGWRWQASILNGIDPGHV